MPGAPRSRAHVPGHRRLAEAPEFNRWETEALGRDLQPDWELWRGIYLEAQEVTPM